MRVQGTVTGSKAPGTVPFVFFYNISGNIFQYHCLDLSKKSFKKEI